MIWFIEFSPAVAVFLGMSIFGTTIVLTSSSLLGVWFGLECNFFGFIPILNGKTIEESESAVKYFIIQSLGSGMIFLGVMLSMSESLEVESFYSGTSLTLLCLLVGLMVKIGLFPFHFWFPSVMGGSSWFNCFMLSTWQKLGLFFFLGGLGVSMVFSSVVLLSGVLTGVVGGVGGIGQVYMRAILAYSSLVHSGWMSIISLVNEVSFILYYMLYMLMIFFFFLFIHYLNLDKIRQVGFSWSGMYSLAWLWVVICLISLSGLPPFVGSVLKLLGILTLYGKFLSGLILMIGMSVLSLFYYLSILFSISMVFNYTNFLGDLKLSMNKKLSITMLCCLVLNGVLGLPLFLFAGTVFF